MDFKLLSFFFSSPLPDGWERKDKLNVELTCYGWYVSWRPLSTAHSQTICTTRGETRLIVQFHFPGDSNMDCIDSMLTAITRDIKYSQNWGCEFCGTPLAT